MAAGVTQLKGAARDRFAQLVPAAEVRDMPAPPMMHMSHRDRVAAEIQRFVETRVKSITALTNTTDLAAENTRAHAKVIPTLDTLPDWLRRDPALLSATISNVNHATDCDAAETQMAPRLRAGAGCNARLDGGCRRRDSAHSRAGLGSPRYRSRRRGSTEHG
jgi:hypothetical protein